MSKVSGFGVGTNCFIDVGPVADVGIVREGFVYL
jgi:hypothetical protein